MDTLKIRIIQEKIYACIGSSNNPIEMKLKRMSILNDTNLNNYVESL